MIRFDKMKLAGEHTSIFNGIEEEYAFKVVCIDENGNEDVYYVFDSNDEKEVLDTISKKYNVKKEDVKRALEYLSFLHAKNPCSNCVEGGCGRCPDVAKYEEKIMKFKLYDFNISELDEKWKIVKEVL